jgi:hypothetical protein
MAAVKIFSRMGIRRFARDSVYFMNVFQPGKGGGMQLVK